MSYTVYTHLPPPGRYRSRQIQGGYFESIEGQERMQYVYPSGDIVRNLRYAQFNPYERIEQSNEVSSTPL